MSQGTFFVRTIHPEGPRAEDGEFDLEPAVPQGRMVCNLFAEFLASGPAEFRQKLPFVNKVDVELEWAAAGGGAAFLAFHTPEGALAMGVLASGVDADADDRILDAMREGILEPLIGDAGTLLAIPRRPAMVILQLPGQPEHFAMTQLLSTALASVFFRAIQRISEAAPGVH